MIVAAQRGPLFLDQEDAHLVGQIECRQGLALPRRTLLVAIRI